MAMVPEKVPCITGEQKPKGPNHKPTKKALLSTHGRVARFMAQPYKPYTEGALRGIHLIPGSSRLDTIQEAQQNPVPASLLGRLHTNTQMQQKWDDEKAEKGKTNLTS